MDEHGASGANVRETGGWKGAARDLLRRYRKSFAPRGDRDFEGVIDLSGVKHAYVTDGRRLIFWPSDGEPTGSTFSKSVASVASTVISRDVPPETVDAQRLLDWCGGHSDVRCDECRGSRQTRCDGCDCGGCDGGLVKCYGCDGTGRVFRRHGDWSVIAGMNVDRSLLGPALHALGHDGEVAMQSVPVIAAYEKEGICLLVTSPEWRLIVMGLDSGPHDEHLPRFNASAEVTTK